MRIEIEEFRESLSTSTLDELFIKVISIMEEMSLKIYLLNEAELQKYKMLINEINNCITNGDFLTISDIIKYDIYPLFNTKEN